MTKLKVLIKDNKILLLASLWYSKLLGHSIFPVYLITRSEVL